MAKIHKWKTQGTRCETWDTERKKINVRMWVHTVDSKDNRKKKQRQKEERNGSYRETVSKGTISHGFPRFMWFSSTI